MDAQAVCVHPLALLRVSETYTRSLERLCAGARGASSGTQATGRVVTQGLVFGTRPDWPAETAVLHLQCAAAVSRSCCWRIMAVAECVPFTPHHIERVYQAARLMYREMTLLGWYAAGSASAKDESTALDASQLSVDAAIMHEFVEEAIWLDVKFATLTREEDGVVATAGAAASVDPNVRVWLIAPRSENDGKEVAAGAAEVVWVPRTHTIKQWEEFLGSLHIRQLSLLVEESEAERYVIQTLFWGSSSSHSNAGRIHAGTESDDKESLGADVSAPGHDQPTRTRDATDTCATAARVFSERIIPTALRTESCPNIQGVKHAQAVSTADSTEDCVSEPALDSWSQSEVLSMALSLALRSVQDSVSCSRLYAELCALEQSVCALEECVRGARSFVQELQSHQTSAQTNVSLSEQDAQRWSRLRRILVALPPYEASAVAADRRTASQPILDGLHRSLAIEALCSEVAGLGALYDRWQQLQQEQRPPTTATTGNRTPT